MISVKMKVNTKGLDALDKYAPIKTDEATKWLAYRIAEIIHDSWSETAPSSPGNPPAVRTGNLDRSVKVEKTGRTVAGRFASGDNVKLWVTRIGAHYAGTLEHGGGNILPRPFV